MFDVQTVTVTLYRSKSGLMAEVYGLPIQHGPEYVAKLRLRELAEEAVRAEYPALKIRSAWQSGETGYVFAVEPL